MNTNNILVTTTSSIEGMKIIKHIQPISAHIVIGTNIFKDIFGGLTDFFGGKSETYQKGLKLIYNDAIKEIKRSCYKVRGNCVVGLKIDIDEISGKGKSMFMITAVGTAVFAEKNEINTPQSLKQNGEEISVKEIDYLRYKKNITKKANEGNLEFTDYVWNFVTNNQMVEILPYILTKLSKSLTDEDSDFDADGFFEKFKLYLENIPDQIKVKALYSAIITDKNKRAIQYIQTLIKEFNLLDFDQTIKILEADDSYKRKIGLAIATYDKEFYKPSDINGFKKLKKSIESSFPKRGEITIKKRMLSSKEKEVWICECGNSVGIKYKYCPSCLKDIYGFKEYELNRGEVIDDIDNKIELIEELQNK